MKKKFLFLLPWFAVSGRDRAFCSMYRALNLTEKDADILVYKHDTFDSKFPLEHTSLIWPHEAVEREYEIAVSYCQWVSPKAWALSIHADTKIQWIHADFSKDYAPDDWDNADLIDKFVLVSKEALDHFTTMFPKAGKRAELIYSIIDSDAIRKEALEQVSDPLPQDGIPNVITVARLSWIKALDRAILVHKRLIDDGYMFRWYVVGTGSLYQELSELIEKHKLQKTFILMGNRMTPFPYMREADIFALPSDNEGFGLVATEAKILAKPILVTDFAGAKEQITSGVNGLIVQNNEQAIYDGLKFMLTHPAECQKYSEALKGFTFDNSESLKKHRKLFKL